MRVLAFDSGFGGLTAVAPLFRSRLKAGAPIDMTFFGDRANLPYGTKTPSHIRALVQKNLEFLLGERFNGGEPFDMLVIACNTASAHALDIAREIGGRHGVSTVGVLDAGCRAAIKAGGERVVVLATTATVESHAYPQSLLGLGYKGQVEQKACPLFVPLVEDNLVSGPAVDWIIRNYLDPVLQPGDTVILGCTHYPFLLEALKAVYPGCTWVHAGHALVDDARVRAAAQKGSARAALRVVFSDSTTDEMQAKQLVSALDFGARLNSGPGSIEFSYSIARP